MNTPSQTQSILDIHHMAMPLITKVTADIERTGFGYITVAIAGVVVEDRTAKSAALAKIKGTELHNMWAKRLTPVFEAGYAVARNR